jgi:hypothetical protein
MQLTVELDEGTAEDVQNIAILNGYRKVEDCVAVLIAAAVDNELRRLLKQYVREQTEKAGG